MYGLAVNLTISPSGHPWIINEINDFVVVRALALDWGDAVGTADDASLLLDPCGNNCFIQSKPGPLSPKKES